MPLPLTDNRAGAVTATRPATAFDFLGLRSSLFPWLPRLCSVGLLLTLLQGLVSSLASSAFSCCCEEGLPRVQSLAPFSLYFAVHIHSCNFLLHAQVYLCCLPTLSLGYHRPFHSQRVKNPITSQICCCISLLPILFSSALAFL